MEHIRQFDWCYSQPDVYFLKEEDLANSVTERILRNKFYDPLISSDSEDEPVNIDWDKVFTKKQNINRQHQIYVPCLPTIQYPKLSALTSFQHFQILKVICAQYPHVLEKIFIPRATKADYQAFEELKPIYEKEQKEYIEWAKVLWSTTHCVKALRPKPHIETVYEAQFKMRANEMNLYPKVFDMAAQIPLETRNNTFDMVLDKVLVNVDIKSLPRIECRPINKKLTVLRPMPMPEPCNKHPCRFILPTENSVSILPLTEIHKELAQYALDNNAQYIASENALRCLVELDRAWNITVTVASSIGPDGEITNVVVLGNEFTINRESCTMRTYRAFRHLLEHSLTPPSEKKKNLQRKDSIPNKGIQDDLFGDTTGSSSDDEDDNLCIDEDTQMSDSGEEEHRNDEDCEDRKQTNESSTKTKNKISTDDIEFYNCTCKDTPFERPSPRSFKKWQVRNRTTDENFDIIIHNSHKVQDEAGEVVLEPEPEYQLQAGASAPPRGRRRARLLALQLRPDAALVNVRIDGATGEVVTFERSSLDQLTAAYSEAPGEIANILHSALGQLCGLLPGHYVLKHEPSHGNNALLYTVKSSSKPSLVLEFDCTQLAEPDEAKNLKTPPSIIPVLLPFHKYRRVLPCAFTPHEQHVSRAQPRLRAARPPPRAIQFPKKKRKRKGKK